MVGCRNWQGINGSLVHKKLHCQKDVGPDRSKEGLVLSADAPKCYLSESRFSHRSLAFILFEEPPLQLQSFPPPREKQGGNFVN